MLTRPAHAGFTLVELLVTVAIIGISMSLALPSFRAWVQNTKIRSASDGLLNGLQLARAEALRRNTRVYFITPIPDGNAGSWRIGCVNEVTADADGDGTADCPKVIQSRPMDAAEAIALDIKITPNDPATTVTFTGLGRLAANADASAPIAQIDVDAPLALLSAAESRELRIIIGTGGQVKMCDPRADLPANDPRRCPA